MSNIIDGKKIAEEIRQRVMEKIREQNLKPSLAAILIGNDPASELYVRLKKDACQKVDINFHLYRLPENCQTSQVLEIINFLNTDPDISAILVQLPLPKQLDTDLIINTIDPQKDADGFHPDNLKLFRGGNSQQTPVLIAGIWQLLLSTKETLVNRQACILANSKEFSENMAVALQQQGIPTEIVYLTNQDWRLKTREADILIVAVGQAMLIGHSDIKKDSIIIDVGTNKINDYFTVGDVNYTDIFSYCSHITPVPGGVGPMTIALLLERCLFLEQNK